MSRIGRILGNGGFLGEKKPDRKPTEPKSFGGAELFVFKGGEPMRILRPKDAAVKLATIEAAPDGTPHAVASELFDRALNEQPHQFVGFAGKDGNVLDKFGRVVGPMLPGDSFVGGSQFELPAFMTTGTFHEEKWDVHTVVVLPKPDLKSDSNTGVVVKSPDSSLLGAIILRPGSTGEVDCHVPSLNRIITGDPNKDYRGGGEAPARPS